MLSKTLLAALLAAPALAAPLSSRAATPLVISLEAPDNVEDVNAATVTATIKNVGSESLTLVNDPNTVLSTFKTNTFRVSSNDSPTKFQGFVVKVDLSKVERTTIEAGKSVTVEHTLAGAYELSTAGKFAVDAVSKTLTAVDADGNLSSVEATVETDKAGFKLVDASVPLKEELKASALSGVEKSVRGKRAEFPGCSEDQQAKIKEGYEAAADYTSWALEQLQGSSSSDPTDRYTTWFGAWTDSRHSTVTDHYTKIGEQDWANFKYNCECDREGVFAFVQPDDFGHIHLCPEYWTHDVKNVRDSNGGTLIHESSHFTKNGGTTDHIYGPDGCKNLAANDPDGAVSNADNHEYFVESRDVDL